MRYIDISKNIDKFIGDGLKWDRKLPKDLVKKFDGKDLKVVFDDYPCIEKPKDGEDFNTYWNRVGGYKEHTVLVNSPKTYGDILKPYAENVINLIMAIEVGELKDWEYGHYYNNLWAERFIFDDDSVEIAIGS